MVTSEGARVLREERDDDVRCVVAGELDERRDPVGVDCLPDVARLESLYRPPRTGGSRPAPPGLWYRLLSGDRNPAGAVDGPHPRRRTASATASIVADMLSGAATPSPAMS